MQKKLLKKRLLSLLCVITLVFCLVPDIAMASSFDSEKADDAVIVTVFEVPDEIREAEHQRQLEEHLAELKALRLEEFEQFGPPLEWRQVAVRREISRGHIRRAGGQTSGGIVFTAPGSGFIWTDGGNNVSVSLGLGWGPVSASFSTGTARTSGVSGLFAAVPQHFIGFPVLLYVTRDFEVVEWEHQWREANTNNAWRTDPAVRNTFTTTTSRLTLQVNRIGFYR